MEELDEKPIPLDVRHIGRFYDKEMPIEQAGMEMSKPGLPDLRRRKHSVTLPDAPPSVGPENPPPTER
jgi:hypothetical protein